MEVIKKKTITQDSLEILGRSALADSLKKFNEGNYEKNSQFKIRLYGLRSEDTSQITNIFDKLLNLQCIMITLECCQIVYDDWTLLVNKLKQMQNLKEIIIVITELQPLKLIRYLTVQLLSSQIQSLSIKCSVCKLYQKDNDDDLKHLVDMKQLKELTISLNQCHYDHIFPQRFSQNIQNLQSLVYLNVELLEARTDYDWLEKFIVFLPNMIQLESLLLTIEMIEQNEIYYFKIQKSVCKLKQLKNLLIKYNFNQFRAAQQITSEMIQDLKVENQFILDECKNLESLFLILKFSNVIKMERDIIANQIIKNIPPDSKLKTLYFNINCHTHGYKNERNTPHCTWEQLAQADLKCLKTIYFFSMYIFPQFTDESKIYKIREKRIMNSIDNMVKAYQLTHVTTLHIDEQQDNKKKIVISLKKNLHRLVDFKCFDQYFKKQRYTNSILKQIKQQQQ